MVQGRSHNLTLRYGLYQFTFFLSCAGIFGFATTYLIANGFTAGEVGSIIAVSHFLACALQPFLGEFADRFPWIGLPKLIVLCLSSSLVCFMVIQFFHLPLVVFGILYAVGGLLITATVSVSNALCVFYSERGYAINYGIGSGIGSLSYSLSTFGMGYVIAYLGTDSMIWVVLLSLSLQLMITLGYPKISEEKTSFLPESADMHAAGQSVSLFSFIIKYKYFMITIMGIILIAMCHSMAENYLFQMFQPMGGSSQNVGAALAIASFSAAPFMLLFEKVQKKINVMLFMRLSGIFYILKAVLMFFASSIWQVYAIVCLQTVTYGFIYPSLFYFAKMKIEKEDTAKGQAVIVAAFTLGTALGSLVGGKAIDAFNFQVMILIAGALAALGTGIINFSINK